MNGKLVQQSYSFSPKCRIIASPELKPSDEAPAVKELFSQSWVCYTAEQLSNQGVFYRCRQLWLRSALNQCSAAVYKPYAW